MGSLCCKRYDFEEPRSIRTVVLIGPPGVGKTAIATRRVPDKYEATMGVDMFVHNKVITWDTAGAPHFANIVRTYFSNADLIIIVIRSTNDGRLVDRCYHHDLLHRKCVLVVVGKEDIDPEIVRNLGCVSKHRMSELTEKAIHSLWKELL